MSVLTTTFTLLSPDALVAVATTDPTTSAYGFTHAQATAIITELNAIILILQNSGLFVVQNG